MMCRVTGFTRNELASRAAVAPEDVDRYVEAGILPADEGDAPFSEGDVRRARFLQGLEQGGVPLDAVTTAVRGDHFSFGFFDAPYWDRFGGLSDTTYAQVSSETGLGLDLLRAVRESLGYASPSPEDRLRKDELEAISLVTMAMGLGVSQEAMERQIRLWGENVRRIAEADAAFWYEQVVNPLLESGMTQSQVLSANAEASNAMSPLLDPALLSMYHAQSEHTWLAGVVESIEAVLDETGLHRSVSRPPAMCFLDLAGYTRLTEEEGDEAAAEVASAFGAMVRRGSNGHGGQPVKWLGDGVMVHFREPLGAVGFALELRDDVPTAGLPPVHVGIAAGPLIFQHGDYFGRTVNLAARIAAYATAHQVLVDQETTRAAGDVGVEFQDLGAVELKGVAAPVRIAEARRRG
jgi:class 3 adenylate cyclase